jgi:hypothetical protein
MPSIVWASGFSAAGAFLIVYTLPGSTAVWACAVPAIGAASVAAARALPAQQKWTAFLCSVPPAVAIGVAWGDECPGYNVDLYLRDAPPDASPLHERWTLHCGPIATLAPDQSVPFEMRFTIPADTPEGEYALYWSLIGPAFTTSLEKPAPAAIVRVLPRP